MKVMKFGGTSVGSPDRMRSIIPLIDGDEKVIVVLSALSGTTNSLIEISELVTAGQIAGASKKNEDLRKRYFKTVDELYSSVEFKKKGHDIVNSHFDYINGFIRTSFNRKDGKAIIAQGELISTALFHNLLTEKGVPSILLPALNFMRIDKDGEPDVSYIESNFNKEIEKYPGIKIIITQGFICRDAYGDIDNLKRGGSDFTASLLGAAVNASEIQIWTDINGFHNNDPRYVSHTEVIRELSFDEAAELAYFGAKILHPATIKPAKQKGIQVRLKNTLDPSDEGTVISSGSAWKYYKAVAAKDGISVIRIRSARMLMAYGFLRKVFEIFEAYKTPIDMITTSEVSVAITIDEPTYIDEIARDLQELGFVEIEKDQTIICVVGDFRPESTGSAPEIFEALNTITLKMISYGGSPYSISLLIDTKDKIEALNLLNQYLFNQ